MALISRAGVSCFTEAIDQSLGILQSPASSCSSDFNKLNKVDLPQPLAPTKPTLCCGNKVAEAFFNKAFPPRSSSISEIWIMNALLYCALVKLALSYHRTYCSYQAYQHRKLYMNIGKIIEQIY